MAVDSVRDLFILASGPVSIEKVGEEKGFSKLHLKGKMEFGDEYHTMHELYQHIMALNVALFNLIFDINQLAGIIKGIEVVKSKLHNDGTMFEGYFVVVANTPYGQIGYHYDLKHWDKFQIDEVERIPWPFDGHSSLEVIQRLLMLYLPGC